MSAIPLRAPEMTAPANARRPGRVSPRSGVGDRRLEDWVVSYLEDREQRNGPLSFDNWMAEGGVRKASDQVGRRSSGGEKVAPRTRCWARIQVQRAGTAILVKLLDALLIKDNVLDELSEEFDDLIRAGYRRIILDCSTVEKLSTRLATAIHRLATACDDRDGGQLRVAGMSPENLEVLRLAGDRGRHADFADVPAAVSHPWPRRGPRPLPLSLVGAIRLFQGGEASGDGGTYVVDEAPAEEGVPGEADGPDDEDLESRLPFFWLIVESSHRNGPPRGAVIPVRGERFSIGRGAWSDLRLSHPQIGRDHARIERVGNRTRIVDLGSALGTIVNGKPVSEAAVTLKDGDIVRMGPFVASVLSGTSGLGRSSLEDIVFDWISESPEPGGPEDDQETSEFAVGDVPGADVPEFEALSSDRRIQWGLIQGVLVINPRIDRLDDEDGVEAFRRGLNELLEDPISHRVVLNLGHVTHVSSRWLGVLFAAFLRLQQDGGMVRLCELHARVFSVLEQVRLPMLIDVTSTLDEAVIRAWD